MKLRDVLARYSASRPHLAKRSQVQRQIKIPVII